MRNGLRNGRGGLFLFALLTLSGCLGAAPPPEIRRVAFGPGRVLISLARKAAVAEALVRAPGGALLLRRGLAGRETARVRLDFPWRPGEAYRFILRSKGGPPAAARARAPDGEAPPFSLSLEIPHGLPAREALLPAGAALRATVKVTSHRSGAGAFSLRLRLPGGVGVASLPPGIARAADEAAGEKGDEKEGEILTARGRLSAANDVWFRQIGLRLPDRPGTALAFEAALRPEGSGRRGAAPLRARVRVRLRTPGALARAVSVERAVLPTDETGAANPYQLPDALILPGGPGQFLLDLLGRGGPPVNPFIPFRYQTLWLRNRSPGAVAVVLSSRVLTRSGREEVPFLRAPDMLSGGTGRSVAFAVLPPGKTTPVVLPLFLDPRGAVPGRYLRRVRIGLWGTQTPLKELDLPLELRRPSLRAFLVTLATLAVALAGAGLLAWRGGRIFRQMPLRLLSGAATFAAALFVLVNIPEFVIGNLARAVLGPFAFLFSNLFTVIPLYALATAYLMRYPVPGALGLLAAVRHLILALTINSFQVIPFLILGAEIVILEGAAWLAGITRGPRGGRLLDRWPGQRWRPALLAGGAFAAADVLLTGASFHLHIFFYRLAFADWYIVLYLAVSSVLYTFAGVAAGLRLGAPLREVAG